MNEDLKQLFREAQKLYSELGILLFKIEKEVKKELN